jgi:uncharacterized protein YgbK (DUF1537 family)
MAAFTAKDVSALRQRTGAGMMDCKKALEENEGDIEKAVEWLRTKGSPRRSPALVALPPRGRSSPSRRRTVDGRTRRAN